MSIVITDVGLQAIQNADQGGFLVDLASFKATEALGVTPQLTDTALSGTIVYSGFISMIEALGSSSIKVTLNFPKNVPTSGSWKITEIGIYLVSGELFAHGVLDTAIDKSSDFGFDLYVVLSAARLGDVINVSTTMACSIASTPHVHTLMPPADSMKNVINVLDEQMDYHGKATTASIATKFGPGSLHWAFAGYERVFYGNVFSVTNTSNFTMSAERRGGFWANNDEVLIVQIISGPGMGESRRVKYTKPMSFVVLEKPFSALTTQSLVSIWRSTNNDLPARSLDVPDYFMLKKARNDWAASTTINPTGVLTPYRFSAIGSGTTLIPIPGGIASQLNANLSNFYSLVHVNGAEVPFSDYTFLYDGTGKPTTIQLNSVLTFGATFDALIFSYDTSASGAAVFWSEANYTANNETTFALPILPDSTANILAYLNGHLVTNFSIVGTNVVFTTTISGFLSIVPFTNYVEEGTTARVARTRIIAAQSQTVFDTGSIIQSKKDTLVYVNGSYISKDHYIVSGTSIVLDTGVTGGQAVDISSYYSELTAPVVSGVSGRDQGPIWADPAGFLRDPNTIVPMFVSFQTDGTNQLIDIPYVSDTDHVLMFLAGVEQAPTEFTVYPYIETSKVQLNSAFPAGLTVDVIAFTELDDTGTKISTSVLSTAVASTMTFNVGANYVADSRLLFIDGVYQHRSTYTASYNGSTVTITLSAAVGTTALLWSFTAVKSPGYNTEFVRSAGTLNSTINDYLLGAPSGHEPDTLLFTGGVYQAQDQYSVSVITDVLENKTGHLHIQSPNAADNGTTYYALTMLSEIPPTRLLTRDEFNLWKSTFSGSGTGGTTYTLPIASASTLGGVKVGSGLAIDASGVLTANTGGTGGTPYTLPPATTTSLGGVQVGAGLSVDANGVLSATGGGAGSGTGFNGTNQMAFTFSGSPIQNTTGQFVLVTAVLGNGGTNPGGFRITGPAYTVTIDWPSNLGFTDSGMQVIVPPGYYINLVGPDSPACYATVV